MYVKKRRHNSEELLSQTKRYNRAASSDSKLVRSAFTLH